jgi:hypothetical protein
MRKIKTSDITTGVGMPIKSGTLDQLQLAYQEALDALAKYSVGLSANDSTNFHVLYGCVNSGSGTSYVISAGAIYYNGEIYLTDTQSITTTGSNVVVGTITTTYNTTNADPVTFTDSSSKYVHEIRKIVWSNAASGSGNINYSSVRFLTYQNRGNIGNSGMSFTTGTGTFNSYQSLDYKRYGDSIFLQYSIKITPATYSGGSLTVSIPLPVAADSNLVATNACIAQVTTSNTKIVGVAVVQNASENPNALLLSINSNATTEIAIFGQIMYKAQ